VDARTRVEGCLYCRRHVQPTSTWPGCLIRRYRYTEVQTRSTREILRFEGGDRSSWLILSVRTSGQDGRGRDVSDPWIEFRGVMDAVITRGCCIIEFMVGGYFFPTFNLGRGDVKCMDEQLLWP
jgi:hypothetical protein